MSYLKNYVQIYVWKSIAFILNLLSMLIVVPHLASSPSIYGIYSFCISISIFFAYGDLGFLKSSQKFAAECYAKSNLNTEKEHLGFSLFILSLVVALISVLLLISSLNPLLLLKDIATEYEMKVASNLLIITGLFSFRHILQRGVEVVYSVRIKDYIYVRINIITNLLKILSVFIFFANGKYNITGYYLTVQLLSLLAVITSAIIAKYKINYNFRRLLSHFRFSKKIYEIEKKLAYSALHISIMWILYYELDNFVIGKFIGVSQVAIYSVSLVFITFFRNIFSILYSPFLSRMNHFIGLRDEKGLKTFLLNVVKSTAPIVVLPITAVSLYIEPLIMTWVGPNYIESIDIARYLALCNIMAFISYPAANLLLSLQRIKDLYLTSSLLPLIYWVGISFTYNSLRLESFGLFKFIAFTIYGIVYFILLQKYLSISIFKLLKCLLSSLTVPVLFLISSSFFIVKYLPLELSRFNLFFNVTIIMFTILIAFSIQYFFSKEMRIMVKNVLQSVMKNQ